MFVTRLTRWVSLVEQELLTSPEHLSSTPVFSEVPVTLSLAFGYVLFVLMFLAIVLSILLLFTDSGYPFGICKLFLILMIVILITCGTESSGEAKLMKMKSINRKI